MSVRSTCPEAAYLTKPNILFPDARPEVIADSEDRAREELALRESVTAIEGGAIEAEA